MSLSVNEGSSLNWLSRIVVVIAVLTLFVTLYFGVVGGLGALSTPSIEPTDEVTTIKWLDNKQAMLFPDQDAPDEKQDDEQSEAEQRKARKDKLIKDIVNKLVDFTTRYPKKGEPRLTSFDTWTTYLKTKQMRVVELKDSNRIVEYLEGLSVWAEQVLKDDEFIAAYRQLKTEKAVEDISRAVYTFTNKFVEGIVDLEKEATLSKADADKKNEQGMDKLAVANAAGIIFFMSILILMLFRIEKHLRRIAMTNAESPNVD